MSISINSAMRAGLVSGKAAAKWKKPAILSQTRAQAGKMAAFDGKRKDEGARGNGPSIPVDKHIDAPALQRDRVSSMPSKKAGGGGFGAATRGSKAPQGGAVGGTAVPGRRQMIDGLSSKGAATFPKGKGFEGRGRSAKTGNTRMKGPIPRSGGPYGGGGKGTQ